MMETRSVRRGVGLGLVCAALLAGCSEPPPVSPPTARVVASDVPAIVVDGVFDDWSAIGDGNALLMADRDYIYARFLVEGEPAAIQASSRTLAVMLDVDADPATGRARTVDDLPMGVDLEIAYSPREDDGSAGRGVEVVRYDADGGALRGSHDVAGAVLAPTYASRWYELRVERSAIGRGVGVAAGEVRGAVGRIGPSGELEGWSAISSTMAPEPRGGTAVAEVALPAKPDGAIRVVSWNVLRGKPREMTGPFARVLDALDPDVVLVQEWTVEGDKYLRGWFNALVPTPTDDGVWSALMGEAWGVGVVSPWPTERVGGEVYARGGDRATRVVGGVVESPAGRIGVASVHLKCCGGANSREDRIRETEAQAINSMLDAAWGDVDVRVVAGDLNLVGTRGPMDTLRRGLAADGSDLGVVRAEVLGDGAIYTWWEAGNDFGPGRLDYVLAGGATVAQAFVLDTSRLGPVSLAEAGLDAGDTSASDHLPVVVDLVPMAR